MPVRKQNIIEKIVKKDYNNELEKILEQKEFGEHAKSTLLSILYKIEASYKDVETVKKEIETKEEYIQNLLDIIKYKCNSIKIIKMSDEDNKILEKRTYLVDKKNKEIIAYPIERKLLYALAKISKKDRIIKDDYFIINQTISDLINIGHNINMVEPLRDFNGYSWTNLPQEIESVEHNLVYQNMRLLIGQDFLNKWVNNNEFIIDYFELFKDKLENKFGKNIKENVIKILSEISILLEIKHNKLHYKELELVKEEIQQELEKMQDKSVFIKEMTDEKLKITEEIKNIDTIVNNKELLEKEYKKRNESLPNEEKIFSMRVLAKIMIKERDENFNKIEKLNQIMNPQNFVKYKNELEKKYKYLKMLDVKDKDVEIDKLKIELQKVFLKAIQIKLKDSQTRQEIEKIVYDFRYYLLLPFSRDKLIKEEKHLEKYVNDTLEQIIEKAINMKFMEKISDDKETDFLVLKNIFDIRIINLEDGYFKITKEKDKYFVQIFDENIFEEKIEIQKPKDLKIKLNKKMSIFK